MSIKEWLMGLIRERDHRPVYILEPDERGTYTLLKWDSSLHRYMAEGTGLTEEQAGKAIVNLERPTKVWDENT